MTTYSIETMTGTITDTTTTIYCGKCGKQKHWYLDSAGTHAPCSCSEENEPIEKPTLLGWTCPVCKRGVSPFADSCNHGKVDYTIT